MKVIFAIGVTAMLAMAQPVFSHNSGSPSLRCNNNQSLELNYGLEIAEDEIRFVKNSAIEVVLSHNGDMVLGGEKPVLDSSSRAAIVTYQKSIRATVPQVRDIALEALAMAQQITSQVLTELLGLRDDEVAGLQQILQTARDDITEHFDSEIVRYGSPKSNNWEGFSPLNDHFDQNFDAVIEEVVDKAKFHILGSLMREVFSRDGDLESFGKRMDAMGEQIEASTDTLAKNIEGKAEQLCESFGIITQQERTVIDLVPGFENYRLLSEREL